MSAPHRTLIMAVLFSALVLAAPSLYALGSLSGYAERGGQTAVTTPPCLPLPIQPCTTHVQASYPYALVTVYIAGTITPATIYSTATGGLKTNPFTADAYGFWAFYAANGAYDIRFSGTGISSPFTLPNQIIGNASGSLVTNVAQYATGGTGTTLDPWTGWDSAITWTARTAYYFPSGQYSYASTLHLGLNGIHLLGDGAGISVLHFTGSGHAIDFDAGVTIAIVSDVYMEKMSVVGNTSATVGLYLRALAGGRFADVSLADVVTGIETSYAILSHFDNVCISPRCLTFTFRPTYGLKLGRRDPVENTIDNVFTNLTVEGVITGAGIGILCNDCEGNTFLGGTSEDNIIGMSLPAVHSNTNIKNTVINFFCEANSGGYDFIVDEPYNTFINVTSNGTFVLNSTSLAAGGENAIFGGLLNNVSISPLGGQGNFNRFFSTRILGTFYDGATGTQRFSTYGTGNTPNVSMGKVASYNDGSGPTASTLTGPSGTVTTDAASTDHTGIVLLFPTVTTPASSGTVKVTYEYPSVGVALPVIVPSLIFGGTAWAAGASVQITARTANDFTVQFDNNGTNLTAGGTYSIGYISVERK